MEITSISTDWQLRCDLLLFSQLDVHWKCWQPKSIESHVATNPTVLNPSVILILMIRGLDMLVWLDLWVVTCRYGIFVWIPVLNSPSIPSLMGTKRWKQVHLCHPVIRERFGLWAFLPSYVLPGLGFSLAFFIKQIVCTRLHLQGKVVPVFKKSNAAKTL